MVSMMSFFIYFIFPLPATILLLLSLPVPHFVETRVMALVDRVMFFELDVPVVRKLSVYSFFLLISGLAFATTAVEYRGKIARYEDAKEKGANSDRALLSKWRAERNLWIHGFAFTLYM